MKALTCQEIRDKWIKYFTEKVSLKHLHIPSASLVPENPTLLLNSAGMVQFVPIFLGTKPAPNPPRAITIQKCARVGGKDSDLENIGRTTRHHSFFEMLGNFSFGDYFKKSAIEMAWNFVTVELGMAPEKLFVSVFQGDDQNPFDQEAYDIWLEVLAKDFPDLQERSARIWKLTRKDNFWGPPGKSGPCGPCSEIYFDKSTGISSGSVPAFDSKEFDDRFVEIWNLVFMEYQKDEEANYSFLAKKNIDTGAGLERIATILQGVQNSFETDELFAVLQKVADLTDKRYGQDPDTNIYLKII
ncbi:MAG: alanine--tRNA ligase, partial [Cyanobacteriota bacterium]